MNINESREELKKALVPNEAVSADIMRGQGLSDDTIQKAITTGTGLVGYDLQAPAKNLYPVNTPIIKSLPRVNNGLGLATNWKQINGITGSGFDATPWIPEGQRAAQMSYNTSNKAASYVTIGEEDKATFEAISAGQGFEDIQASMTMRLLQKAMLKEEDAVLMGNSSVALGVPTAPSLSASGSGATLPAATYSVIIVALTAEGLKNTKPLANSVVTSVAKSGTFTGADGQTYTLNGGSSNKSSAATQAVTLGQTLFATATAVTGAVAYAWYVGTAGNEKLQTVTTINSASFAAPLGTTGELASAVTADCSVNTGAFNGFLATAFAAGSGAYVKVMGTGTAGVGTPLTASGKGSVNEIDDLLQNMWDNYQVTPTIIYVNSQEIRNITTKVLSSGSASLLQYRNDATEKSAEYHLAAGGTIEFYYNPYLGRKIPIKVHPRVPAGTIIGWAEDLPPQYQSSEIPNMAEIKTRRDWYQIDWPLTTRSRQVGVYAEEVLAIYAPFTIGVVTNIANG